MSSSRAKARRSFPSTTPILRSARTALLADPAGKQFRFVNRIPLERGLGSSAAAIALGLVAAAPHASAEELLAAGVTLEPHADNLAAALLGGLTLSWDGRIARIAERLPLDAVALIPRERTSTESSRQTLPATVPHAEAAASAGRAALLGAGAASGDAALFAAALDDWLHEPYRPSETLAAIRADPPQGCAGATLSGSGPTVIAWVRHGAASTAGAPEPASRITRSSRSTSLPGARCEPRAGRRAREARPTRPVTFPAPSISTLTTIFRQSGRIPRSEDGIPCRTTESSRRSSRGPESGQSRSCWRSTTAPAGRHAAGGSCVTSATMRQGTFEIGSYLGPLATEPVVPAPGRSSRGRAQATRSRPRRSSPGSATRRSRSSTPAAANAGSGTRSRSIPSPGAFPARSTPRSPSRSPTERTTAPELVSYCGSGVTACVIAQRLVLAGRDDVRLYPGSFSEWCRREGYPIEKGTP